MDIEEKPATPCGSDDDDDVDSNNCRVSDEDAGGIAEYEDDMAAGVHYA